MWDVRVAEQLARAVHAGQTDKAYEPYVSHTERVARYTRVLGGGPDEQMAAWLHDVVEDTCLGADDLLSLGCPIDVLTMVLLLTRKKGQTSEDYYAAIKEHPGALRVKHADLLDNTDHERLARLDVGVRDRLREKYAKAWAALGLPTEKES